MITYEDVKETTERKQYCLHCRLEITPEENRIKLSSMSCDSKTMFNRGSPKLFKFVLFHKECFREIAGEEYMFSDE